MHAPARTFASGAFGVSTRSERPTTRVRASARGGLGRDSTPRHRRPHVHRAIGVVIAP